MPTDGVVVVITALVGSSLLSVAASWWFNRKKTHAETDHERADADHANAEAARDWIGVAESGWSRVAALELADREKVRRISELEQHERINRKFQSAALPILKECANGNTNLAAKVTTVMGLIEAREIDESQR